MLKKLAISAIASAIVFAPMVSKAEWIPVSENNNLVFYVEDRITTLDGQPAFFWQRMVYKKSESNGAKAVVFYNAIRCNQMTTQVQKIITYGSQGQVIKQQDYGETSNWEFPPPDTHQGIALQAICE
ncbi:surface-adhesin E family protein [Nostoc sp. CALU 1950]|uniref:surface-adhesin E family protein n=1 Tax=Nostoc sp. CALU 1950 TaxID=3104321 RepID=UPI003EB7E03D